MYSDDQQAIAWSDRAISTAAECDLPPSSVALRIRGGARCFTGDLQGLEDLALSIATARELGHVRDTALGHNESAVVLAVSEGPGAALAELEEGTTLARRSGLPEVADYVEAATRAELLYDLGRWDELLAYAFPLAMEREDVDVDARVQNRAMVCDVASWRGDLDLGISVADGLPEMARSTRQHQNMIPTFDAAAHLALVAGEPQRSVELLRELLSVPEVGKTWNFAAYLPELVRTSLEASGVPLAEAFVALRSRSPFELDRISNLMVDAELAEAGGDISRAADRYAEAGDAWTSFSIPERGQALLGLGRCRVVLGEPAGAAALREARGIFASLGAQRFITRVDELLELALRLSS
jgi:hypothetical protein